ncbi:hypothetical protein HDV00_007487 [Rhizophlyctis rosea]|nr:hypothetical protein HDV00_007487 [Rhizophlyctis rosea]
MRLPSITALLAFLLCLTLATASPDTPETRQSKIVSKVTRKVVELNDANFDTTTATGEWVVEFYANWCSYCRQFAETYELLAERVEDELEDIKVGRVDIDKNPDVASRFFVQRLPTIFHITNKEVREVPLNRDGDVLFKYLRDEDWKEVEPFSAWLSPFSPVGRAVGFMGSFGQRVQAALTYLRQYFPTWVIFGFLGLVLIASFALRSGPATKPPTKIKKTQ